MFAIAAVSQNWGIGKDNHLLFHISADMKRFRELTEGKTVLMGRKTLQSLPGGKGLPRRRNIVLTANSDFAAPDAETAHTPVQAVFTAGEEAAVIGGESVYRLFLPLCERVYITKVFADIAEEEVAITSKSSKAARSSSNFRMLCGSSSTITTLILS